MLVNVSSALLYLIRTLYLIDVDNDLSSAGSLTLNKTPLIGLRCSALLRQ